MSGGWEALGLLEELVESLATDYTSWVLPTDIQDEAIPLILGGGDVLASAETGSGKTGAFALPILQLCTEYYRDKENGAKVAAEAKRLLAQASINSSSSSSPSSSPSSTTSQIMPNILSENDRDTAISISPSSLTCQSRSPKSWSGVRTTTGITNGSYYFEVTPNDDGIIRIGCSTNDAIREVGKDSLGYGYGGTGFKVFNNAYANYPDNNENGKGTSYTKGDTVGCYISLNSTTAGEISWSKNGVHLGLGFHSIAPKVHLFPCVSMKNGECTLNLGSSDFNYPPKDSSSHQHYLPFIDAITRGDSISNSIISSSSNSSTLIDNSIAPTAGNGPLCIVLEPVRDLAEQTYETFMSLSSALTSPPIKCALLIGGDISKKVLDSLKNNQVDVLIGTPPIIAEMIKKRKINTNRVKFFVLDEADQLTIGESNETVKQIYKSFPSRLLTGEAKLQVCFFSATLHSEPVKDLVEQICSNPTWIDLKGVESVPDTVHHCVVRVDPRRVKEVAHFRRDDNRKCVITDSVHRNGKIDEKVNWDALKLKDQDNKGVISEQLKELKPLLLLNLIDKLEMEQVLVFCRTNLDCNNLEKFLLNVGGGSAFSGKKESGKEGKYSCCVLAGMRSMQERRNNLAAFKEGDVRIMIATDVAARGLDIKGLPYVINMTLPDLDENYVHRIGRVGRAERMGLAISIVAAEGVSEKVWYCQNKLKPPQADVRLYDVGGNCIWTDEHVSLTAVEKRLHGLKITQLRLPALTLPIDIENTMKSGGYGEHLGATAEDPELAKHLEELKGEVRDLGVLEFNLQTNFLRLQRRFGESGGGEGRDLGKSQGEGGGGKGGGTKHATSGYGRLVD